MNVSLICQAGRSLIMLGNILTEEQQGLFNQKFQSQPKEVGKKWGNANIYFYFSVNPRSIIIKVPNYILPSLCFAFVFDSISYYFLLQINSKTVSSPTFLRFWPQKILMNRYVKSQYYLLINIFAQILLFEERNPFLSLELYFLTFYHMFVPFRSFPISHNFQCKSDGQIQWRYVEGRRGAKEEEAVKVKVWAIKRQVGIVDFGEMRSLLQNGSKIRGQLKIQNQKCGSAVA